jgi:hypothetical protein
LRRSRWWSVSSPLRRRPTHPWFAGLFFVASVLAPLARPRRVFVPLLCAVSARPLASSPRFLEVLAKFIHAVFHLTDLSATTAFVKLPGLSLRWSGAEQQDYRTSDREMHTLRIDDLFSRAFFMVASLPLAIS